MLSGQDYPIDDWSNRDEQFAKVSDRAFVRRNFSSYPSLRRVCDGLAEWKPYDGGPFDATEWVVVPGGWDHEHCSFCMAKIVDGMSFWANGNDVILLCDYCHGHYTDRLETTA